MSLPISISKTAGQLPVDPLLVVTRTAIGLGLGILMADKIKPPLRQAAAIALVAIGAWLRHRGLSRSLSGKLIGPNRNGEVARGCAPFAETLVIAPTTTFIEAL